MERWKGLVPQRRLHYINEQLRILAAWSRRASSSTVNDFAELDRLFAGLARELGAAHRHDTEARHKNTNFDGYTSLVESDYKSMINFIGQIAALRFSRTREGDALLFDGSLRCNFDDTLDFDAYVEQVRAAHYPDAYRVHLSKGLCFSLDDFFARCFCNGDFFATPLSIVGESLWPGCECWIDAGRNQGNDPLWNRPVARYLNYAPEKPSLISIGTEEGCTISLFHSMFFSTYPIGSDDRVALISLAVLIALTWIIHHEAAHVRNGHFRLLRPSGTEATRAGLFRVGEFQSDQNSQVASSVPQSVLELQADILATKQTIRWFFAAEWAADLPGYACRSPAWLARLIATSIGIVTLIFEKRRQLDGVFGDYPTPMSRLGAVLCTSLQLMPELLADRASWVFKSPEMVEAAGNQVISMVAGGSMCDLAAASSFLDEGLETFDGPIPKSLKDKFGDDYKKLQSLPSRELDYPFPTNIIDGAEMIPYAQDVCILSDVIAPGLVTPYERNVAPTIPSNLIRVHRPAFQTSKVQDWLGELYRLININAQKWPEFRPVHPA
ncbi:MAG: hypothetical protein JO001_02710 [Alphaproteobacteria bacterium]|nr:hypothetical protein [Alphaproteobacteria bacterium]